MDITTDDPRAGRAQETDAIIREKRGFDVDLSSDQELFGQPFSVEPFARQLSALNDDLVYRGINTSGTTSPRQQASGTGFSKTIDNRRALLLRRFSRKHPLGEGGIVGSTKSLVGETTRAASYTREPNNNHLYTEKESTPCSNLVGEKLIRYLQSAHNLTAYQLKSMVVPMLTMVLETVPVEDGAICTDLVSGY